MGRASRLRPRADAATRARAARANFAKQLHVSPFMGDGPDLRWRVAGARARPCRCTSRASARASARLRRDARRCARRELTRASSRADDRALPVRDAARARTDLRARVALKLKGCRCTPIRRRCGDERSEHAPRAARAAWLLRRIRASAARRRRGRAAPRRSARVRRPRPFRSARRACGRMLLHGSRGLAEAYARGPLGLAGPGRADARRGAQRDTAGPLRRAVGAAAGPAAAARGARAPTRAHAAAETSPPTTTSATSCSRRCSTRR